ncbi:MAG: hypothetical protein KBC06_02465 [Candidatus Pacebacteria bacterium]|nr:hypothetical protein [Candidatus Paceibacterota bacterium]
MIRKIEEEKKAIVLRKQGKTYTEILKIIPVAKSTLGIWLKNAKLSLPEKQIFSENKRLASLRGGQAKKKQRIEKQAQLISQAKSKISSISQRELFLIGVILYWAEGSKEKEYHPGSTFAFSNMDSKMIQVMLVWLLKVCKIKRNMLIFNIFLHKTHECRVEEVRKYWSRVTGFPVDRFKSVYWKKSKLKTNRRNTKEGYNGLLKIKVKESSELVRKVAGWSEGISEKIVNKK